jgi:hypothetical protein
VRIKGIFGMLLLSDKINEIEYKGGSMNGQKKGPLKDDVALAGHSSNKGHYSVEKHRERISNFERAKQRSSEMFLYLQQNGTTEDHYKLQGQLGCCANYLVFNHYYTIEEIRLSKAITCKKHMVCPFCARQRAARLVSLNLQKFDTVISENPSLIPVHIVFTVKNGEDLQERFTHIHKSFKLLQKRRTDYQRDLCNTQFGKVEGGIFAYEITRSKDGWHPHIHMVALLSDYIDQATLSAEWERITGDSFIVSIQRICGDPVEAMLEVFKYSVKFSELSLSDNLHCWDTLKGRRLLGSFGCFYGLKMPKDLNDDLPDDLPYQEWVYRYDFHKKAYILGHIVQHDDWTQTVKDMDTGEREKRFCFTHKKFLDEPLE